MNQHLSLHGQAQDTPEPHISSELSSIDPHKQHDPEDEAVWENKRVMLMEWTERERKKADEKDAKDACGGSS